MTSLLLLATMRQLLDCADAWLGVSGPRGRCLCSLRPLRDEPLRRGGCRGRAMAVVLACLAVVVTTFAFNPPGNRVLARCVDRMRR